MKPQSKPELKEKATPSSPFMSSALDLHLLDSSSQSQSSFYPSLPQPFTPMTDFFGSELPIEVSASEASSLELNDVVSSFFSSDFSEKETKDDKSEKILKIDDEKKGSALETIAAYYARIPPVPYAASFGKLEAKTEESPGFSSHMIHTNLPAFASKTLKIKIPALSLSPPAVRGVQIAFGSDMPRSRNHYLFCLDSDKMKEDGRGFISGFAPINEPVNYTTWLTNDTFVCALGGGILEQFKVNFETREIKSIGRILGIHTDDIREISALPHSNPNFIASTGFDGKLCITDVTRNLAVRATNLNAVGGSVKWTAYNDACIGCTTDNGIFQLVDIRTGLLQVRKIIAGKPIYTHLRYTPDHVLLGSDDGHLMHYDFRTPALLSSSEDPYCEGIGMIEFNQRDAIVTSGYADFSVWKQDSKTNETNVWSHSQTAYVVPENKQFSCAATFIDSDTVVATDSSGFVGLWAQGFDMYDFDQ